MRILVDANLFRCAYLTVSTEETRYYLNGVFVQPHPVAGVFLVSTDGHRLTVIHDETGQADRSAIISLSKDALKACKPSRNDARRLIVELSETATTGRSVAHVLAAPAGSENEDDFAPVAIHNSAEIDGTFPDWRRVVPRNTGAGVSAETPAFNGKYLASLGELGAALKDERGGCAMTVHSVDVSGPALVRWPGISNAFSVLMPVRHGGGADVLPAFFDAVRENAS